MNYQHQGPRPPRGRRGHPRGNYNRGRGVQRGHWHHSPNNQFRPRFINPSHNWSGPPNFLGSPYTFTRPGMPSPLLRLPTPLLPHPTFQERPFRSPPPLPPARTSPLPGSEEYIQRNIKETSERIKKQLNLDNEEDDEDEESSKVEISFNSTFKPDAIFSEVPIETETATDEVDGSSKLETVPKATSRRDIKTETKYNVEEIRNKIIAHITNLSAGKKVNLINIGSESYDEAIHQIQKNERLAIIRALRDTCCNQTTEANSILNSIIPDMHIKIEDLPAIQREELSTSLKIFSDEMLGSCDSTVDPDLMFQQAQDMLSEIPDDIDTTLEDVNILHNDVSLCDIKSTPLNVRSAIDDIGSDPDTLIQQPLGDPTAETLKLRELLNKPVISSDMNFRKTQRFASSMPTTEAGMLQRQRALEESYKQFETEIFSSLVTHKERDSTTKNSYRYLNDTGRFKSNNSSRNSLTAPVNSIDDGLLPSGFNFRNSYLNFKQNPHTMNSVSTDKEKMTESTSVERDSVKRVVRNDGEEASIKHTSSSRHSDGKGTFDILEEKHRMSLDERIAKELQQSESHRTEERRKSSEQPTTSTKSHKNIDLVCRSNSSSLKPHEFLQPKPSHKVTETSKLNRKKIWRSPGEKKFMAEQKPRTPLYDASDTELDFWDEDENKNPLKNITGLKEKAVINQSDYSSPNYDGQHSGRDVDANKQLINTETKVASNVKQLDGDVSNLNEEETEGVAKQSSSSSNSKILETNKTKIAEKRKRNNSRLSEDLKETAVVKSKLFLQNEANAELNSVNIIKPKPADIVENSVHVKPDSPQQTDSAKESNLNQDNSKKHHRANKQEHTEKEGSQKVEETHSKSTYISGSKTNFPEKNKSKKENAVLKSKGSDKSLNILPKNEVNTSKKVVPHLGTVESVKQESRNLTILKCDIARVSDKSEIKNSKKIADSSISKTDEIHLTLNEPHDSKSTEKNRLKPCKSSKSCSLKLNNEVELKEKLEIKNDDTSGKLKEKVNSGTMDARRHVKKKRALKLGSSKIDAKDSGVPKGFKTDAAVKNVNHQSEIASMDGMQKSESSMTSPKFKEEITEHLSARNGSTIVAVSKHSKIKNASNLKKSKSKKSHSSHRLQGKPREKNIKRNEESTPVQSDLQIERNTDLKIENSEKSSLKSCSEENTDSLAIKHEKTNVQTSNESTDNKSEPECVKVDLSKDDGQKKDVSNSELDIKITEEDLLEKAEVHPDLVKVQGETAEKSDISNNLQSEEIIETAKITEIPLKIQSTEETEIIETSILKRRSGRNKNLTSLTECETKTEIVNSETDKESGISTTVSIQKIADKKVNKSKRRRTRKENSVNKLSNTTNTSVETKSERNEGTVNIPAEQNVTLSDSKIEESFASISNTSCVSAEHETGEEPESESFQESEHAEDNSPTRVIMKEQIVATNNESKSEEIALEATVSPLITSADEKKCVAEENNLKRRSSRIKKSSKSEIETNINKLVETVGEVEKESLLSAMLSEKPELGRRKRNVGTKKCEKDSVEMQLPMPSTAIEQDIDVQHSTQQNNIIEFPLATKKICQTRSRSKRVLDKQGFSDRITFYESPYQLSDSSTKRCITKKEKQKTKPTKSKRKSKRQELKESELSRSILSSIKTELNETNEENTDTDSISVKFEYPVISNSEESIRYDDEGHRPQGLLRVKSLSQLLQISPDESCNETATYMNISPIDPTSIATSPEVLPQPSCASNEETIEDTPVHRIPVKNRKQNMRKRKLPGAENSIPNKKRKVVMKTVFSQTESNCTVTSNTCDAASQVNFACTSCESYKQDSYQRQTWINELQKFDETIRTLLTAKAELYHKLLKCEKPARRVARKRILPNLQKPAASKNEFKDPSEIVSNRAVKTKKHQTPNKEIPAKTVVENNAIHDWKLDLPCYVHLYRYTEEHFERMKRDKEYLLYEENRRYRPTNSNVTNKTVESDGISNLRIISVTSLANDAENLKDIENSEEEKNESSGETVFNAEQLTAMLSKYLKGVVLVLKVVGTELLAATDTGKIHCFNLSSETPPQTISSSNAAITSLCVISNKEEADTLCVGALDATLKLYNLSDRKLKQHVQLEEKVQCMESMWGYIFMGSDKGHLTRYSTDKNKREFHEKISESNVLVIRATTEGGRKVLLVALKQSPVCVRDAMSGLLMRNMEAPFSPSVYTLLFVENLIYCGTSKHGIIVHNFHDGQIVCSYTPQLSTSSGVVILHILGNLLYAGCYNGNIYIFNIATNEYLGFIKGPGGLLLSMTIIGNMLVVGTKHKLTTALKIPDEFLKPS